MVLDQKINLARARKDFRIGAGADPVVAGWQCFLEEMLIKFEPYFQPGRMITFQSLLPPESEIYERLATSALFPPDVCAVYIPPSVIKNLVSGKRRTPIQSSHIQTTRADDSGIVLASRCGDYDVIVNMLLAHPPYHPGIDVYEDGRLLAGYTYETLSECGQELTPVMQTYLAHTRRRSD